MCDASTKQLNKTKANINTIINTNNLLEKSMSLKFWNASFAFTLETDGAKNKDNNKGNCNDKINKLKTVILLTCWKKTILENINRKIHHLLLTTNW